MLLSKLRLSKVLPFANTNPTLRPAGNRVVPETFSDNVPPTPKGISRVAASSGVELITFPALVIEQPKRHAPPCDVVIETAGAVRAVVGIPGTPQSKLVEAMTVRVAVLLPVPPGPAQVRVYEYKPATVMAPAVNPELAAGSVPVQMLPPAPPLAVHDVAFAVDQDRIGAAPG